MLGNGYELSGVTENRGICRSKVNMFWILELDVGALPVVIESCQVDVL